MTTALRGGLALLIAALPATAQWDQATPTTSAPPLSYHAMSYDSGAARTLVFGGDTLGGPFGAVSDQTWSYDGTTWTNVTPALSPSARTLCNMVYDANRGVTMLYGGVPLAPFGGAPAIDETWEWNGSTWTQVFPITTPGGYANYAMAHDSARGRTVLYGGQADTFFVLDSNETWEFDGFTWAQITPANDPGPLERSCMCYHEGLQVSVLFGGFGNGGVINNDVWLWDGTDWTVAPIAGPRPPVRAGCRMAYDTHRQTILLAGGYDPSLGFSGEVDETWELDLNSNTWTQVQSFTTPRSGVGLAYDIARRQMVMFGGFSAASFSQLDDTWEYGAKSQTFGTGCAGSNGVPTLDATDAPRFGLPYTLNAGNLNTTLNVAAFALSLTEIAPVALDGVGMPGCTAYASPDVIAVETGAAGSASHTIMMPASAALIGTEVFSQAVSLDPGINALELAASNGHRGVLGN